MLFIIALCFLTNVICFTLYSRKTEIKSSITAIMTIPHMPDIIACQISILFVMSFGYLSFHFYPNS